MFLKYILFVSQKLIRTDSLVDNALSFLSTNSCYKLKLCTDGCLQGNEKQVLIY
jgi:hypothetical protein